jgi:hypothetical protein
MNPWDNQKFPHIYSKSVEWYTRFMNTSHPKQVRRILMSMLYGCFQQDPMQMLSPVEILDHGTIDRKDLIPNAHYLHDRKLIELMIGYNPPTFAATRIAPLGIDLIEDAAEFDKLFPPELVVESETTSSIVTIILKMADEAEESALKGQAKDWLMRDLEALREELVVPESYWKPDVILARLQWLDGFFMHEENVSLPSLESLKTILHKKLL